MNEDGDNQAYAKLYLCIFEQVNCIWILKFRYLDFVVYQKIQKSSEFQNSVAIQYFLFFKTQIVMYQLNYNCMNIELMEAYFSIVQLDYK